jgi:DNA modification methylase
MSNAKILVGDARSRLSDIADATVQTCVTSPPYWGLRDYGHGDQIGLEESPEEYAAEMVAVFREVRRVLADDGTLWLNVGDSYASQGGAHGGRQDNQSGVGAKVVHLAGGADQAARMAPPGLKPKDLVGIPWRLAFALQADGWWLRQDIIWAKPNPMPESVTDRCTKAHEYVFLLTKSARYRYDAGAISEAVAREFWNETVGDPYMTAKDGRIDGGKRQGTGPMDGTRNRRSVWSIATKPYAGAHFAVMPQTLVEPCILAGSRPGDLVLDPFAGSGTVGVVALRHNRDFIGVELNPEYAELAYRRITDDGPLFNTVEVVSHD